MFLQTWRAHRVMIDWVSSRLTGKSACCYFSDTMCARQTPRIWARSTCLPVRHEGGTDDARWRLTPGSFSVLILWSIWFSDVLRRFNIVHYHSYLLVIQRFPRKQSAASLENHSSMSFGDSAWNLPLGIRTIYTACSIPSLLEIRESEKKTK